MVVDGKEMPRIDNGPHVLAVSTPNRCEVMCPGLDYLKLLIPHHYVVPVHLSLLRPAFQRVNQYVYRVPGCPVGLHKHVIKINMR